MKKPSPSSGVGGEGIRISTITFVVDKSVPTPTLTMKGEKPHTEYGFELRVACIGQPSWSSSKRYCDPSTVEGVGVAEE